MLSVMKVHRRVQGRRIEVPVLEVSAVVAGKAAAAEKSVFAKRRSDFVSARRYARVASRLSGEGVAVGKACAFSFVTRLGSVVVGASVSAVAGSGCCLVVEAGVAGLTGVA